MGLGAPVGVIEHVVGGLGKGRGCGGLDDGVDLDLLSHIADSVVAEAVRVGVLLAGAEAVLSLGAGELVEVVVAEALGYRTCGKRRVRRDIYVVREGVYPGSDIGN